MADLPPKYDPIGATTRRPAEETNDPLIADARNYYKVEKWTKDGTKIDHMLYAGSSLDKAREVFCSGDLPSAAHSADDQAADTYVGAVAEADAGREHALSVRRPAP